MSSIESNVPEVNISMQTQPVQTQPVQTQAKNIAQTQETNLNTSLNTATPGRGLIEIDLAEALRSEDQATTVKLLEAVINHGRADVESVLREALASAGKDVQMFALEQTVRLDAQKAIVLLEEVLSSSNTEAIVDRAAAILYQKDRSNVSKYFLKNPESKTSFVKAINREISLGNLPDGSAAILKQALLGVDGKEAYLLALESGPRLITSKPDLALEILGDIFSPEHLSADTKFTSVEQSVREKALERCIDRACKIDKTDAEELKTAKAKCTAALAHDLVSKLNDISANTPAITESGSTEQALRLRAFARLADFSPASLESAGAIPALAQVYRSENAATARPAIDSMLKILLSYKRDHLA